MKKTKIANSIIIRVGGGIREVQREPAEITEVVESVETETDFEPQEDLHSFKPGFKSTSRLDKNKVIN